MPVSEWQSFLRSYRNENPNMAFRTAQKRASALYKMPNACNKTNLTKKIKQLDNSGVQRACIKLDTPDIVITPLNNMKLEFTKILD